MSERQLQERRASGGPAKSDPANKPSSEVGGGRSRYPDAWRALGSRNFRLYAWGQGVSLIGSWMSRLALAWLTYRLTHSALMLGLVGFSGQIFTFLLAPFAGVWVDRMDRRKLLVWTQVWSGLQSLALAALTLSKVITIDEVLLLASVQGFVDAFDMPARQSFVVKMVDRREDLPNAIALNSTLVQVARLIGPVVAGWIIAISNEGWCFLVDAISYVAVIASLQMMRVAYERPTGVRPGMVEQMREGWSYVRSFVPVRNILLLFAVSNLMGFSAMVLLPIFATQVLHGGAHTLGFLTGANGTGAMVAALLLARRKGVLGLEKRIQVAVVVYGVGLLVFGASRVEWLSLLAMVAVGFGMMQTLASSNTVIQTLVPESRRGRVMGYYTVAFVGMLPFGSLLVGWLAHSIGAPDALLLTGAALLVAALIFFTQRGVMGEQMRTRYRELGILPGVKGAVQETAIGRG